MPKNRKIDIHIILQYHNVPINESGQISCFYHEDKKPSAFVMTGNNAVYCRSCEKRTTITDLIKMKEQEKGIVVSSNKHAWKIAYDIVEEFETNGYKVPEIKRNESTEDKEEMFEKRKYFCSEFDENSINKYLIKRGILPGNLKYIYNTLSKNDVDLGVDKFGQFHIFFNKFKYCIYRRNDSNINANAGSSTPIIFQRSGSKLVIVEGIFDALSLLQFKDINVDICTLNSASNAKKFINGFKAKLKGFEKRYDEIFLILDNDHAGDRATKTLLDTLQNISNKIKISDYRECFDKKYKDINEHITKNKSIVFDTNISETRIVINCANRIKQTLKDRLYEEECLEFLDEEIMDMEREFEKITSISEFEKIYIEEKLLKKEKDLEIFLNTVNKDDLFLGELFEDMLNEINSTKEALI